MAGRSGRFTSTGTFSPILGTGASGTFGAAGLIFTGGIVGFVLSNSTGLGGSGRSGAGIAANASYFCHVSRKKVSNSASALFLKSSNSCCCCFAKSSNSFSMSCAHKCVADKKKATKAAEKHFILFICTIDLEKLK